MMSDIKDVYLSFTEINEVEPTRNFGEQVQYKEAIDMAVKQNQMQSPFSSGDVDASSKTNNSTTIVEVVLLLEENVPTAHSGIQFPVEGKTFQLESWKFSQFTAPDPIQEQASQAESSIEYPIEGGPLETSNLQVPLSKRYLPTPLVEKFPGTSARHAPKASGYVVSSAGYSPSPLYCATDWERNDYMYKTHANYFIRSEDIVWYNGYPFRTIYSTTDSSINTQPFEKHGHSTKVTDVSHTGNFPRTPHSPRDSGRNNKPPPYELSPRFATSLWKSRTDSKSNFIHSRKVPDKTVLPAGHSPKNNNSPSDSRGSYKSHHKHHPRSKNTPMPSYRSSSNDKTSSGCVDSPIMSSSCTSDSSFASHIDPSIKISGNCAESQSSDLPSSLERRVFSYRKQRELRLKNRGVLNTEALQKDLEGNVFFPSSQTQKSEDAKIAVKIDEKTGIPHSQSSDTSHVRHPPGGCVSTEGISLSQSAPGLDNVHLLEEITEVPHISNVLQISPNEPHMPQINPNELYMPQISPNESLAGKKKKEPLRNNKLSLEAIIKVSHSRYFPSSFERHLYSYTKQSEPRWRNQSISNPEILSKAQLGNQPQELEDGSKSDSLHARSSDASHVRVRHPPGNNVSLEGIPISQSAPDNVYLLELISEVPQILNVPQISPNEPHTEPLRDNINLPFVPTIEVSQSKDLSNSLDRRVYSYRKQRKLSLRNRTVSNPETLSKASECNFFSPSNQHQKPEESSKNDISHTQYSDASHVGYPPGDNVCPEEKSLSQSVPGHDNVDLLDVLTEVLQNLNVLERNPNEPHVDCLRDMTSLIEQALKIYNEVSERDERSV